MIKRFFIIFASILFSFNLIFAVNALAPATVNVNSAEGHRGEEVTLIATLEGSVSVRSGAVSLEYDNTVLQLVNGTWNIANTTLSTFKADTEKGAFAFASATEISGTVFTATFKILDSTELTDSSVKINIQLRDADKNDMTVVSNGGIVKVKCNHSFIVEEISDEYLNTPATCTDRATYFKLCSECGEKGNVTFEAGEALIHKWSDIYYANSEGHYRSCTREGCDADETVAPHSGGESTCTEKAVCFVCHNSYGELAEHVFDDDNDADCNNCGFTRGMDSEPDPDPDPDPTPNPDPTPTPKPDPNPDPNEETEFDILPILLIILMFVLLLVALFGI